MALTPKEQRELRAMENAIASIISRHRQQQAKVKRVSDAQGDRVQVQQNNQLMSIPILSNQTNSSLKIK